MKEISIEDHHVIDTGIDVQFYHGNDWKSIHAPLKEFEDWIVEKGLLNWNEVVMKNGEHIDDREGTWEFSDFIREKLDDAILEKFVVSHMEKMKSQLKKLKS